MKSVSYFALMFAGLAMGLPQVNAQPPVFAGGPEAVFGTTIGPDGTYYALVPAVSSTPQNPSTELLAISNTAGTTPKWTAMLTGRIGQVLPGATTVFVVQSVTSGNGRNSTTTTSILLLSGATGAHSTSITPAGNISDIEVRTINGSDYLYVSTFTHSSSTSGATITSSLTRTLTIYSATGAVIKTAAL